MITEQEIKEHPASVLLHCNVGSSDKVYQANLIEDKKTPGKWLVNYAYGRRGAVLTTGSKTTTGVDYDTAYTIYKKLITEKRAKGYDFSTESKQTYYDHVEKTASGESVQLLNAITLQEVKKLLSDDDWIAQEKFDGHRKMVKKLADNATGINRKGLIVALPDTILTDLLDRTKYHSLLLDGEQVGSELYVFDILGSMLDLKEMPLHDRLDILKEVFAESEFKYIHLVETAYTTKAKQKLFMSLEKAGREGIVFKRKDSKYTPGRPNSGGDQLKYKFYETASFIVHKLNAQRSVEIKLIDPQQSHKHILVGNVTIPVNHKLPAVNDVIEVRYLYAYEGGSVYQPVYLGKRNDIDPGECVVKQLKYKSDD